MAALLRLARLRPPARRWGRVRARDRQSQPCQRSFAAGTSGTLPVAAHRKYDFQRVEDKWREAVVQTSSSLGANGTTTTQDPFYVLSMFPYPSGNLHMGHARVYTLGDCIARYNRLKGHHVVHPMGWDAFGLPAENAAVERGVPPADWTRRNIESMRGQLNSLGLSFDWDREVATCDPEYYRWTQWLFLQLFHRGLAYKQNAPVNWDPVDCTVLANEQVDSEGRSWRSGALVETKELSQWFFRITDYADRLLAGLDGLKGVWPSSVLSLQRNWIGKSSGAMLSFDVACSNGDKHTLQVFTTRPDTLGGVTFLAVHPDHALTHGRLEDDQRETLRDDRESKVKRGVRLLGVEATNPLTDDVVPVYAANYVLADHGSGAVMGVPAHDERDWQFAQQHDSVGIKFVIQPPSGEYGRPHVGRDGTAVNSGQLNGLTSTEAASAVVALAEQGGFGQAHDTLRIRDWLVSRQRYWGVPIPIVDCQACGSVPVLEEDLPVMLPPRFPGQNPENDADNSVACPRCAGPAKRETDTMDTFVDSSWYFLRYLDPRNDKQLCDPQQAAGMPVDLYVGGIEHAILHLLYARFVTHFLHDIGVSPVAEPFKHLLAQGMVHGRTFVTKSTGKFLDQNQVEQGPDGLVETATGAAVQAVWAKMSKSKGNGVDPTDSIATHGTDATRLYLLFKVPPDMALEWNDSDVQGVVRWLDRLWTLVSTLDSVAGAAGDAGTAGGAGKASDADKTLRRQTHEAVASVSTVFEETRAFNVAIADLMKLSNTLRDVHGSCSASVVAESVRTLLVMLAPMAPHVASELWEVVRAWPCPSHFDSSKDVLAQSWPAVDQTALVQDVIDLTIQVGGKFRGTLAVPLEALGGEDAATGAEGLVRNSDIGQRWLAGKNCKKVVFVPKRHLINFVIAKS
eukprot:m.130873 g.130873  ORF g.130873 m.130873 type:complete len:908 (-) comp16803_c0_seq1:450-3173(-)